MSRRPPILGWTIGVAILAVLAAMTGGLIMVAHHSGSAANAAVRIAPTRAATTATPAVTGSGAAKAPAAPSAAPSPSSSSTGAGHGLRPGGPATTAPSPHSAGAATSLPQAAPVPVVAGPSPPAPGTYRYRQAGTLRARRRWGRWSWGR